MNLTLYKCADDKRVVSKTLTNQIQLTGTLREACSVLNPSITIESSSNLSAYNYAYITEFGRYYFVTDVTAVTDKLWTLKLAVDVLMTYSAAIKSLDYVIVNRSADRANFYLNDDKVVKDAYENIITRKFSNTPFDVNSQNLHYIFITTGG